MSHLRSVVLLIAALSGAAAFAQVGETPKNQPHVQHLSVGFSKAVRSGAWTPLRLTLRNPGPATDVEIVVFGEDANGNRLPLLVRSQAHLAENVTRVHGMLIRTDDAEQIAVEVLEKGRRTHRVSESLYQVQPSEILLLGLSNAGPGYSCAQERESSPRLRFNSATAFSRLPNRWQGYESVDVIILGSLPPEQITPSQEQAIADWVRAGGVLILSPGGEPSRYEGTVFESLMPVEILGARLVENLPPIEAVYGPLRMEKDRIGLAEVALKDGVVEAEMGPFPLIVTRKEGLGRVVFVAFDLSADRVLFWPHLERLYRDLIRTEGRLPPTRANRLSHEAGLVLSESLGVRVMSRSWVAAFLGFNVILTIVLLLALRRQREYAFLILVIAAPVLALGIHLFGQAASPVKEPMARGLHVAQTASATSAGSAMAYQAVVTGEEAHCDVYIPENPTAFPHALSLIESGERRTSAEAVQETFEVTDSDIKRLHRLHLRPKAVSLVQSSYMTTMPGVVEARATYGPTGVRFDITNRSEKPFTRGLAACNRTAAPIGDLAPGQSTQVTLVGSAAQGLMTSFSHSAIATQRGSQDDRIVRSLYEVRHFSAVSDTGAHAFGWIEDAPATMRFDGLVPEPSSTDRTLWVVAAETAAEGGRILLPKGTIPMDIATTQPGMFQRGRWSNLYGAATLKVDFTLPHVLRHLTPTRAVFFLRVGQSPVALSIEVYDPQKGEYVPLLGEPSDLGIKPVAANDTVFAIPSPEKYFAPGRNVLALRVGIVPDGPAGRNPNVRQPVLEDLDLEVEGNLP